MDNLVLLWIQTALDWVETKNEIYYPSMYRILYQVMVLPQFLLVEVGFMYVHV